MDRNPQTFVNIPSATREDYRSATQRGCFGRRRSRPACRSTCCAPDGPTRLAKWNRKSTSHDRRRLCTITGFYRYAVEEELLDRSPAAHVHRPELEYESHAIAVDRNEANAGTAP